MVGSPATTLAVSDTMGLICALKNAVTPFSTSWAVVVGATGILTMIREPLGVAVILLLVPGTLGLLGSTVNNRVMLLPLEADESNSTCVPVLKLSTAMAGVEAEFRWTSTSWI